MAVSDEQAVVRAARPNQFPYDFFMEREGIPVHRAVVGVDDVTSLPRADWARCGGRGVFIELDATFQSERGLYVAEIPGGAALAPEKHLYEEAIVVLQGSGVAQVWQGAGDRITFEWGEGSLFALPPNTWHQLFNSGPVPALFMAVTTAPRIINALDDLTLVFESERCPVDLYARRTSYFQTPDTRTTEGWYDQVILHSNFIPDTRAIRLDDLERKVAGGQLTGYRMGKRFPHGHISEWSSGRYHKAHYHEPGAVLLGLDGEGYVLAWDSTLGTQPYRDGHEHAVVKVNWGRNSIYSPPNGWFHQHFNSGAGPARHVAVYGELLPLGVHGLRTEREWKGMVSLQQGGTLIEYEDEDPRVRDDFEADLRRKGIRCEMR